jgi:hypothetical protein
MLLKLRSRIITDGERSPMAKLLPPIHPGETIREDVLEPLGMSVNQLAKALNVDAARLNEIVRGRRGISADGSPCGFRSCAASGSHRSAVPAPAGLGGRPPLCGLPAILELRLNSGSDSRPITIFAWPGN